MIDPTLKLPRPAVPADVRSGVRHVLQGNTIRLILPDEAHEKVVTSKYQTEMRPNARLAGMLTRVEGEYERRLVPLVFAEVHLPHAPAHKTPRLRSRLAASSYVFCWDERRRCGYLLVRPPSHGLKEVSFHVDWESAPGVNEWVPEDTEEAN